MEEMENRMEGRMEVTKTRMEGLKAETMGLCQELNELT